MYILHQLASYLDTQGIGTYSPTSVDGDIFLNFLPIQPEECIGLFLYGGVAVMTTRNDDAIKFDRASIQIYVRGNPEDALTPQTKAKNIYNLLCGLSHTTLMTGGDFILNILPVQSEPVFLERDNNLRFEYTVNLMVEYQNISRSY
jgi:hypothetical protein